AAGLTWTAIVSPTIATTTKIGWFKDEFLINFSPEALAMGDVNAKIGLSVPPSGLNTSYPTIGISGFSSLVAANFLPAWSNGQNRQIKNATSWIKRSHSMKFGAEVTWIQTNNVNARNKGGSFSFSGRYSRNSLTATGGSPVADFLLGAVDGSNFSTSTRIEGRATMWAGYFQDDWKVTRRLTVNLSARYECMRPFQDKYNKLSNFDLDTDPLRPALVLAADVGKADFLSSDFNNVQPRVGLAYQIKPEKLVLRAGYG